MEYLLLTITTNIECVLKTRLCVVQGRHATQDEITACAYQAVNIDNKYNGAPVQVRVTMGKEPRHFLAIFKGKLIIYEVNHIFMWLYSNEWRCVAYFLFFNIYVFFIQSF